MHGFCKNVGPQDKSAGSGFDFTGELYKSQVDEKQQTSGELSSCWAI